MPHQARYLNKFHFSVPVALIIGMAVLSAGLQLKADIFIYWREFMPAEPWRWWTAHWVHVSWPHYWLNILAFLCLPFIFPGFQARILTTALLILSPLLSLGLYVLLPEVQAYAGLSGLLHGLYVMAALNCLFARVERKFAGLVLAGIIIKVLLEKWLGHSQTAQLIGAPVLIEAHQLGVLLGAVMAVLINWLSHRRQSPWLA